MAGGMSVSLHLTQKTQKGVHVPKFDGQNGFNVLGNTIKVIGGADLMYT
jgi:hypothetical protein